MKQVVCAIIMLNGKYLVTRRAPLENHAGKWEFPGGKIEPGETPEISLMREITEELGISIKVGEYLCSSIFPYKDFTIELMAFFADFINGDIHLTVHDKYMWASIAEMQKLDFTSADIPIINKLSQ